jgi:hypothetical protein
MKKTVTWGDDSCPVAAGLAAEDDAAADSGKQAGKGISVPDAFNFSSRQF